MNDLEKKLRSLLNCHSAENASNTPDFILSAYLLQCLDAFNDAIRARDDWYDIEPMPGWRGADGTDANTPQE